MSDPLFIANGGLEHQMNEAVPFSENVFGKKIVYAGLRPYQETRRGITRASDVVIKDGKVVIETSEDSVDYLRFFISFEDGSELHIWDDAQYCCERRYMTCDDDCSVLVGGNLLDIEIATIREINSPDDTQHDIVIVKIQSEKGHVVLCTHNEHNGYYGGFNLTTAYYERKEIDKSNSM